MRNIEEKTEGLKRPVGHLQEDNGAERIFKEMMVINFPNLIQEA